MTPPEASKPRLRPFLPVTAEFASGKDSPRQFLERCLADLEAWEPGIQAFVSLNLPAARIAADRSTARWRAGRPLSPIDGMPIGVKDIIETVDMPTENGSPLFAGFRGNRDAASVAALRAAGALILGKTVTTEFAWFEPSATRNPWDFNRTPGGSSSGSAAAVAVGAVSAALGTQVVGSIVRPASFCGCFGFKPTVGAINRGGAHDFLSQSAHGLLAASLADMWQVAWEVSQRAGGDPGFPGLDGPPACPAPLKPRWLAVLETDGWTAAEPTAKAAFKEAADRLKSAGVTLIGRRGSETVAAAEDAIHGARTLSIDIIAFESRWPLNTYRARDASKLSQAMLDLLARGEAMSPGDYREALADRSRRRRAYRGLTEEFDACLTLSAPGAAPEGLGWTGGPAFAVASSMLGVPAISLPALEDSGLPLGLQLIGFADADAALFSIAGGVMAVLQRDEPASGPSPAIGANFFPP
jgi:Asp-tRNA(Asn)/Glu-tRNA(Gln) amidotransferase A subunit family amidase